MDFRNFFSKTFNLVTGKKSYSGFFSNSLPSEARNWDGGDFLNAMNISLYTNRAIIKRSEKVSEIEFVLKDKNGKKIEQNPMLDILWKPNDVFSARQFWKLYQQYYDLVGEVYILLERKVEFGGKKTIKAMHLLTPTLVTPQFGTNGKPVKFKYQTGNETKEYEAEDIIYIFNPDPQNPLRGQSLLRAGINSILTEDQINQYHSKIFKNGGKVEGIVKFKTERLTEEQLKGLKDQYEKQYAGAKKSGKPMFLGGDAEYINVGLSPQELSFLEAKKMTLEDICILTGVPKSMLGSTQDVKFDNADADKSIFLRETIVPLLGALTDAFDYAFFPDDLSLTFVDPTPENVDQKLKEVETGIKSYYMTINEAREMRGLDPVPEGDVIMVPFSLVGLGDAPESEETKSIKKKESEIEHPLRNADVREVYGKMTIKRADKREKKFKTSVDEYFNEQRDRLVARLQPNKTHVFRKKDLLDENFDLALELKMGSDKFLPALTEMLKLAGADALSLVGSSGEFILSAEIVSWLDKRAGIFVGQINETTFAKLKEEFQASLDLAEGREELIKRIERTYGDIKKSRAAMIARTEVHNATQYGTLEGYKQAGLTTKIWVSVMDEATRESHASIDGEERPMNTPFSNGLMLPGDPNGPAEETINCRCTI